MFTPERVRNCQATRLKISAFIGSKRFGNQTSLTSPSPSGSANACKYTVDICISLPAELAHQYCDPFAGGFRHKRNQDRYALPVVVVFLYGNNLLGKLFNEGLLAINTRGMESNCDAFAKPDSRVKNMS